MATTPTTIVPALHQAPAVTIPAVGSHRRRRISAEAGHALEKLGHAIDYLTDEYIHERGAFSRHDPQMQAVEMLMAANRQIYFACPEVPTFGERLHRWFSGVKQ